MRWPSAMALRRETRSEDTTGDQEQYGGLADPSTKGAKHGAKGEKARSCR